MIFTPAGISKTFLKLQNRNHIYSGPTELTQYFVRYCPSILHILYSFIILDPLK